MNDKKLEIERYNKRAQDIISHKYNNIKKPKYLNIPYKYYFSLFKKHKEKKNLLEIGAGTGENTFKLIKMNFNVCATDISSKSVEVLNKKFKKYKNFSSKVADMEKLPFKNESYDIICSAGSLSYGENSIVMSELYRVLKPLGVVIIVDSLNNNIIFRLNRYVHFYRGKRSRSTITRIPNINLIKRYTKKFGNGKVKFFGSVTWIFPLLKIFISEKNICMFSDWVDKKFKIKKSAFKFVLILQKNNL